MSSTLFMMPTLQHYLPPIDGDGFLTTSAQDLFIGRLEFYELLAESSFSQEEVELLLPKNDTPTDEESEELVSRQTSSGATQPNKYIKSVSVGTDQLWKVEMFSQTSKPVLKESSCQTSDDGTSYNSAATFKITTHTQTSESDMEITLNKDNDDDKTLFEEEIEERIVTERECVIPLLPMFPPSTSLTISLRLPATYSADWNGNEEEPEADYEFINNVDSD